MNTTPHTPAAKRLRAGAGSASPHALAASLSSYALLLIGATALIVFFSFADTVFIKQVSDLVLGEREMVSWIVAVALTVGSVCSMLDAGHLARRAETEGTTYRYVVFAVAGWAVLGTALVLLRWNGAALAPTEIGVAGDPAAGEGEPHATMALLLGLIYMSSGALSFLTGRNYNPVVLAYLRTRRRLHTAERSLAEDEGLVTQLAENVQIARGNLAALPSLKQTEEVRLGAFADTLMAEARMLIASALADPAATGITGNTPTAEPRSRSPLAPRDETDTNEEGGR